jgi:PhnB protein
MTRPTIFNFTVRKDERTITVERSFQAPLNTVWDAWTRADILCKWWAPAPYQCVIQALDFRPGGRWSYCMQGPEGDRHYCFFDYTAVRPKTSFTGHEGFCDEQGAINEQMPRMNWECHFSPTDGSTLVRTRIGFDSAEDLETIVKMGFKEGFSQGMDQLEELLADS